MKKKIKLAAFLALVIVWGILVLISSMFIGDLMWELTYEMYGYNVSPFIPTIISISTSIVFGISTSTLGLLVFQIIRRWENDLRRSKKRIRRIKTYISSN